MITTRRRFMQGMAAGACFGWSRRSASQPAAAPRFLVVVGATGGASILDSAMAVRASESASAPTLAVYPDAAVASVPESPFRAVQWSGDSVGAIPVPFSADQLPFFRRYRDQMLVATVEGTSVNHAVGQRRSVTGNEVWGGRTVQEAHAAHHGRGAVVPNVLLSTGNAFVERGTDPSLPDYAVGESVSDARLWPLSLDGSRGIGPSASVTESGRRLRDAFDADSAYVARFGGGARIGRWRELRGERARQLEAARLVDRLLFLPDTGGRLSQRGLSPSPDAERVRAAFPNYDVDPLDAQGALAFLLLKHRVSVSVTLGPSFSGIIERDGAFEEGDLINPPIAFDFSHQSHRATQALMWDRILSVMDRLIGLLQGEEFEQGESLWDRTVMYVATEFGRTRNRPAGAEEFGSGHDLRNGCLVLSPRLQGNRVLGGVDPNTLRIHGWDPVTGALRPDRTNPESDVYGGLLELLDVPGSGLSVPAFRSSSGA
jgi:hypothetical protein